MARGPKTSAQRAKPSKAARAQQKKYDTDNAEKLAYRSMKTRRGVVNLNLSRKERIKLRRGGRAAVRKSFAQQRRAGIVPDLSGFMVEGMSKEKINAMLFGSKANKHKVAP